MGVMASENQHLTLPTLPDNWHWVTLESLIAEKRQISYGVVQPGTHDPNGVAIIRVNNLRNGRIVVDDIKRISPNIADQYSRTRLIGGEVLLSLVGTLGECAIVPKELKGWNIARAVGVIPLRIDIEPEWISFNLRGAVAQHYIHTWATTTVQATLNLRDVAKLPIALPPKKERTQILEILSAFDDKIELNRQMNTTLEETARALFKSWFVDFDPVRRNQAGQPCQPYDHLFPDRLVVDGNGRELPEGWNLKTVPDAFDLNPPRKLSKGKPAPYLEMSNMPTSSARAMNWEVREYNSGMRFKNGDVLLARITPCLENGKKAFVDFLEEGHTGWGSTEYIVLRSKAPLPPEYAYFFICMEGFRSHAIANMTGTSGRQRVPKEAFHTYPVIVPSPAIADMFGEMARSFFRKMKQNDQESRTLADLRDTLLPRLMSGRLRVLTEPEARLFRKSLASSPASSPHMENGR
jgi:type I restriction enzyme, S subunit